MPFTSHVRRLSHQVRHMPSKLRRPKLPNTNDEFEDRLTFGDRAADKVAAFGGSWTFVLLFMGILAFWMALNTELLPLRDHFDPYPFILLNLMLSTLAAFQAPIIMMSQNRQAAKDRLAVEHDYEVNLRSESEIRALRARLDALHDKYDALLESHDQLHERHEKLMRHLLERDGAA
ncbi:MAG: DUF1003 domain-containing protein [Rhodothermales bacterium]|nr:DUF1003 domain-containing protein [Rhodothermales bacterium]